MQNQPKLDVVFDFRNETKKNPKALGTVHVRVYFARNKRKYISTGVRVLASQWSSRFRVYNHPDAPALNSQIRQQLEKAEQEIQRALERNAAPPTVDVMKLDRTGASFLNWVDNHIEKINIAEGTRRHHRVVFRALMDFNKIRRFEDVKPASVREFIAYISKRTTRTYDASGRPQNTTISQIAIHDYYKRIASWVHAAQAQGYIGGDALLGVKIPRGETAEREHLTESELQQLLDYTPTSPHLQRARDLFLIQCASGLAYADLMHVDFKQNDTIDGQTVITGRRTKTKQPYFIVLLNFGVTILEKYDYILPRISNQKYNTYLGAIAMQSGINKRITSHVGRHTYACICLSRGVRIEAVQRTLGHASIKTTQIYARLVDQDVLEAFKKANK